MRIFEKSILAAYKTPYSRFELDTFRFQIGIANMSHKQLKLQQNEIIFSFSLQVWVEWAAWEVWAAWVEWAVWEA
jgi:hypothetical protein